jgi:hypothetical protein
MTKKLMMCALLFFFIFWKGYAQEPNISITFETDHFLFGQPVNVTYTIVNLSKEPIWVAGKEEKGKFLLMERESKVFYPDGKEVPQHKAEAMIIGNQPIPKKKLASGEKIIWTQLVPVTDVSIDNLPSGKYTLVFYLKYSLKEETVLFEKEAEATANFYIEPPKGEDAAWLNYVKEIKKSLYLKDTTRVALNQPLTWWDVLDYAVRPPEGKGTTETALQKFPTSTYAGYALLGGNGPWNLLPIEEIKMRGLDLKTAEKWPETKSQVEREEKERWERNERRAKQLQAFLAARPDFVYADFLKLELATRLAYIEKYQESERICRELTKKSSDSKESQKAKSLLEYMSEQGWIKSGEDKTASKDKAN